jgi:hypothetical protein
LAIFALIYTLLMTVGVKESARYLLPIFPMLAYIAAWGWLKLFKVRWQPLFVAGLGITAVLFTIQYAPYYFTYLNPLVGGPGTAAHLISIGWGQGLDEVARWLNDQPDPIPPHLGARYTATINPFYRGEVSSPVSEELDYVAFYIKQTQNGYPSPEILGYFEQQTPLHRVIINGLEYAQIYQGPAMVPIEVESDSDIKLPVAYRPYKIYAPIGESLEVDLLWPADDELDAQAERSVTLILTAADQSWTASATAPIIKQGPNVIVSRHQFDLPPDLDRDSVELRLEQKTLGQLKTRLMSVPDDFQPLSTVFNNQINLAGIKQTRTPEGLDIELAWQGWSNVSNDYTIFIQLLDSQGERITGVDIAPDPGFTQLDRKEVKLTQHSVPLPTDMNPGEYTMLIGLYYFAGDQLITIGSVNLDEPIVLP